MGNKTEGFNRHYSDQNGHRERSSHWADLRKIERRFRLDQPLFSRYELVSIPLLPTEQYRNKRFMKRNPKTGK